MTAVVPSRVPPGSVRSHQCRPVHLCHGRSCPAASEIFKYNTNNLKYSNITQIIISQHNNNINNKIIIRRHNNKNKLAKVKINQNSYCNCLLE